MFLTSVESKESWQGSPAQTGGAPRLRIEGDRKDS